MTVISGIRQNNFIIIGRAGMDFYADPPGTKTEEATHFFSCLGGSSANIGAAITRHGGKAALRDGSAANTVPVVISAPYDP